MTDAELPTPRYSSKGNVGENINGRGTNSRTTNSSKQLKRRSNRRNTPYQSQSQSQTQNSGKFKKVYVGNLSWDVTWKELKDHAKSNGLEVMHADVMMNPDGRSKGFGIIELSTHNEARKAIRSLNESELDGRQIYVKEDRQEDHTQNSSMVSSGGGDSNSSLKVFVGNLSWEVTWQDLKDHMRQAGVVAYADVMMENDGRSKGCGIAEFENESQVEEAIKTLDGTDLKGRNIFVREDRGREDRGREDRGRDDRGRDDRGRDDRGRDDRGRDDRGRDDRGRDDRGRNNRENRDVDKKLSSLSVYVGNLSYDTSWQDLKDRMRQAGNVDQAKIITGEDGRSKGCAIVTYQNVREAERAIRELQDSVLDGRPIFVREDREAASTTVSGAQLFVGNLSYDTSWQDLKDHFRQSGDVERVEVIEDRDGRKKGFGTVKFYKQKDASNAMRRLNGLELQGRRLEVRLDQKTN